MKGSGQVIVLYILGGILLLLVLVTLIPARVRLEFREAFSLELGILFFHIPLFPGEGAGEPEPEKEEKQEEEEKKPKKLGENRLKAALKREGFQGFLQSLGELIGLAGRAGARVLKRLRLREFDLYLCLAGYSACGGLFTLMPCRHKGVTVDLDYSAQKSRVVFSAELSLRPFFVLKELLVFFLKSLWPLGRILKMMLRTERKVKA